MDKFTLYDFLGLLLPGALFVWFINILNMLYEFVDITPSGEKWELVIGIGFCLSIILGSMLYAFNFWLAVKGKIYKKFTGTYKHVTDIYLKLTKLHPIFNETLNKKARAWCGKDIFFENDIYKGLDPKEKEEIRKLQDEYYQRMYYELEYYDKIEYAKTFQSFYYFFRQLLLACFLILIMIIILQLLCILKVSELSQPEIKELIQYIVGVLITLFLSIGLARWYRKRMVQKMYWAYYTHLNQA